MDPTLRREISDILSEANDLTLATLRNDGYPQATTVSFASDGFDIYFGTGAGSQKAKNLVRNDKVSATVTLPYRHWGEIRGLSLAGRAYRLTDPAQIKRASELLTAKFAQAIDQFASLPLQEIAFFRVRPEVISVLNYGKGFGHTELVTCAPHSVAPSWPQAGR